MVDEHPTPEEQDTPAPSRWRRWAQGLRDFNEETARRVEAAKEQDRLEAEEERLARTARKAAKKLEKPPPKGKLVTPKSGWNWEDFPFHLPWEEYPAGFIHMGHITGHNQANDREALFNTYIALVVHTQNREPEQNNSATQSETVRIWNNALRKYQQYYPNDPVILRNVMLGNHQLSGIDFQNCIFQGGDLFGANLNNANLRNCTFINTNTRNALLTHADLEGASINGKAMSSAASSPPDSHTTRANRTPSDQGRA